MAYGRLNSYVCMLNSRYYLIGQNTRICLTDGEWDGREPVCEGMRIAGVISLFTLETAAFN